jgi:diguanylate cyclase (GGDEF)-like protein
LNYRIRLSHIPHCAALVGKHGVIQQVNTEFKSLFGKNLIGLSDFILDFEDFHIKAKENENPYQLKAYDKDGKVFPIAIRTNKIATDTWLVIFEDQSYLNDLKNQYKKQMLFDDLTKLPKRRLMEDRVSHALERFRRDSAQNFALVYLDLDNYTEINEAYGRSFGDQVLKHLSTCLQKNLRSADSIARMDGDEFCILLEGIDQYSKAIHVVNLLRSKASEEIVIGDVSIEISFSTGICLAERHLPVEALIQRSFDSMLYAKTKGLGAIVSFDPEKIVVQHEKLIISRLIDEALVHKQFYLVYQPILSLKDGRVKGFETLMRWKHPDRGFIGPGEFIPIAEEHGKINALGQWVLENACDFAKKLLDITKDESLFIAVNVSGIQFSQAELVKDIDHHLRRAEVPPSMLKIEITETEVMKDPNEAEKILYALREMGLQISIDDFGTGFSSLSYLQKFPVESLKIDRSFVQGIQENNTSTKITESILFLARSLNLEVIAEGIETNEQLQILQDMNCHSGQGFFFSEPIPGEVILRKLENANNLQWFTTEATLDDEYDRLEA